MALEPQPPVHALLVLALAACSSSAPRCGGGAAPSVAAAASTPARSTPSPARYVDLSSGQGPKSGTSPSAMIDAAHGALLVATTNEANGSRASLFRCALDGSGCAHTDLSAGMPPQSGYHPQLLLDAEARKLLAVMVDWDDSHPKLALVRCELDGSGCVGGRLPQGDLPGGRFHPTRPGAVIDPFNKRLLIVPTSPWGGLELVRCRLDGTDCSRISLTPGLDLGRSGEVTALIDGEARKLLVITSFEKTRHRPSLLVCELDGSACVHHELAPGAPDGTGRAPSAILDVDAKKLLVATGSRSPDLFRCEPDGTHCTAPVFPPDDTWGLRGAPVAIADRAAKELLVVTSWTAAVGAGYHACALDGTRCGRRAFAVEHGALTAMTPTAVLDDAGRRLLIVAAIQEREGRPGLFLVPLP